MPSPGATLSDAYGSPQQQRPSPPPVRPLFICGSPHLACVASVCVPLVVVPLSVVTGHADVVELLSRMNLELEQAPHRIVQALKEAERVSKPGSKLQVGDYDTFHATQGDLPIPEIAAERRRQYCDAFEAARSTISGVGQGAFEKHIVQPLTKHWLDACLKIEGIEIAIGEEVGYHVEDSSSVQFFHGFADKIGFNTSNFSSWDKSKPGSKTVSTYDCPIPAFGVWEDKGIDVLGKEEKAQLMAEMKGFHEALFRTRGIQAPALGGMLINITKDGDRLTPSCVCVLVRQAHGRLFWMESQVLQGVSLVADAVSWWIGSVQARAEEFEEARKLLIRAPPLDSLPGDRPVSPSSDHGNESDDDVMPVFTAASAPETTAVALRLFVAKPIDHEADVRKRWVTAFVHGNTRVYAT